MDTSTGPDDAAAKAASDLALVQSQVEAMRAVLVRLLQDVAIAESRLETSEAEQLLEANERLVVAAMAHQQEAETASQALSTVSRSAQFDVLTQLPNRTLLLDRLGQAISNAKRNGTSLAVLFVDLNHFKDVNDTLGHAVGDQVLRRVARCLSASVREADTVSRHGGDEFLILLTEVGRAADAHRVADKVIAALEAPTRIGDHVLRVGASIGISMYPQDGLDADTLIERADAAMYQAKARGPASFVFHAGAQADNEDPAPPLKSLQRPSTSHGLVLADNELRYEQLCEANEQLVLSALNAQELCAASEEAHHRQTEFLALIANELGNTLAPIRIATSMLDGVKTDEPPLPHGQAAVSRQVEQMARLIDDLLGVARVKADET